MCKAGNDTLQFKQLYFCMYASLGVLAPYVPVFFERLQMSKSQIGILLMIPSISSFIFAPPWSMLCDRFDIRSEVMFFALVASQILTVSMYFFGAFWSMSLIVVFGSIVKAPLSSLLDSLVIDSLEDKASYGSLRLWGAVSFALTSFLGGAVIAAFGEPFIYVFGLHGLFGTLSGCIILSMTLNSRREKILAAAVRQESSMDNEVHVASNSDCAAKSNCDTPQETTANLNSVGSEELSVMRSVYRVMTLDPSVGIFLVVVFCSGLGSGVIDSFLFLRLKQLGGSGLVMGISRAITCIAEVPCFMVAGALQKRLGTWRLLAITQLAFFIRFTYYSFLTVPWAVLPCEVLHGFTFAIMWTTACTYADEIAPKHVHSTVQAIVESIHWGLGSGLGSLLGGFAYNNYGAVTLFKSSAAISLLSTALAIIASIRYGSPRSDSTAIAFSAVPTTAPENMEDGSTFTLEGDIELVTIQSNPMAEPDTAEAEVHEKFISHATPVTS